MAETVRATCPGCQHILRIPADWTDRAVKCKNCGTIVQTKQGSSTTAKPVPPAAATPPTKAPKAAAPKAPAPKAATPKATAPAPTPAAPAPVIAKRATRAEAPAAPPFDPAAVESPLVAHRPTQHEHSEHHDSNDLGFDPLAELAEGPVIQRRPKVRSGPGPLLFVGVGLFLLITGLTSVLVGPTLLKRFMPQETTQTTPATVTEVKPVAKVIKSFPRRMLFLSATKYLYCNTLSGGTEKRPDQLTPTARRWAASWNVPNDKDNDQLYVVQDVGTGSRTMTKATIEDAYKQFCESSRGQDRVMIYFGGHAVEVEDKAYLVPVDGELEDAKTLIPLEDFWAKVKACPAQQKVIIFDVCRINEDGDKQRPGSEPLSESLEKKLTKAPVGVEVILTTTAGHNAFEYRAPPYINRQVDTKDVGGSLFLSAIRYLDHNSMKDAPTDPTPDDPLPISKLVAGANGRMKEFTSGAAEPAQDVRILGTTSATPTPYNAEEPPAKRFTLAPQPKGVPVSDLEKILTRINTLPPYRGKITKDDAVETLVPFSVDVMKTYMPDNVSDQQIMKEPEKYPLRKAAIDAFNIIKKEWKSADKGELRTRIDGASNERFKKLILDEQTKPALIEDELRTQLMRMEKLMDQLGEEKSKYWQVNFLYAVAQLRARVAFMSEYNLAMGSIRTDSLPKVDDKQASAGFILVSSEKMKSKKDVKDLAESARELFTKIADDYKGTPWAVQAKRHRVLSLGLEWKPYTSGLGGTMD